MKQKLVIVGAGGHAKVVAEAAQLAGFEVVGFVDRSSELQGTSLAGIPVLGDEDLLLSGAHRDCKVVVAIGDNQDRQAAVTKLEAQGVHFVAVIHPSAVISTSASVGAGTVVLAGAVVNSSSIIGEHCIVNTLACVEHDTTVEDFAHVSPGVHLAGGCRVGALAHIGIGANVLPNLSIGVRAVIGAGAVVISEIPDRAVAVGVPAKVRP